MAEQQVRFNLGASAFPLLSDWMGRSVIIPNLDQVGDSLMRTASDEPAAREAPKPQIYYAHNVMPVGQGFKSIGYKRIIRPPQVATPPTTFTKMIPIKDPNETKGFMGITSDGRLFMINAGDPQWVEVTAQVGGWPGGQTSYAYANGYTYLCLQFFGIFKLSVANKTLAAATLAGITNNLIKNVTSSSNYLILTDQVTTYWSNAANPEDFVPSLSTGAGSGTPQDLNGQIQAAIPLSNGFAIYTSVNIIVASYSGNIRYPWIFKQAPNSGGITDIEKVAWDSDGGSNYAWTSAGLLKVLPTGCQPIHPEVTDFLAGRVFEDCDDTTLLITQQYLTADLQLKLVFIGSRFLIISYGVNSLTHALVYDTALKRWGKMKIAHVDCFPVILFAEKGLQWQQLYPQGWSQYAGIAWQDLTTISNTAASAKRTIGFLQQDGSVQLAVWDYGNFSTAAILMLGKYELSRGRQAILTQVIVESIDTANPNFATYCLTANDGKVISSYNQLVPNSFYTNSRSIRYSCRWEGDNHTLLFKGAFSLVSVDAVLVNGGQR